MTIFKIQIKSIHLKSFRDNQEHGEQLFNKKARTSISNSEKSKNTIIIEFERLKGLKDLVVSTVSTKDIINKETSKINQNNEIIKAYKGTKEKNHERWENLILFLNLTQSMDYIKIANIISAKKESFRKKLVGLIRAKYFLKNFKPETYSRIDLSLSVFQKINDTDWNEVLNHINKNSITNE
ncbi:hypothetical protein C1646_778517 [Rhizophagus diaphanus]|nr:hypothetical protein C1646_778517 [Rhizophagus diaphanus] [Rhizophagus sp. MUCL 43196]